MNSVSVVCVPLGYKPNSSEKTERYRCSFDPKAVVLVREMLNIRGDKEYATHSKIVFKGDCYEHHAVEVDMPYDEVLKLIGWSKQSLPE